MHLQRASAGSCACSLARTRSVSSTSAIRSDEPAAVAPLVVVPGDVLDHVALDHDRPFGHEDARVRVADDVAGDERVGRVLDDPLERPLGGAPAWRR